LAFQEKNRKICEERGGKSNNNGDDEKVENKIETAVPAPDLGVSISKGPEATSTEMARQSLSEDLAQDDCNENDIGRYVGRSSLLSYEKKTELLKWLVYSRCKKGAFCKYCALFPPNPNSFHGVLGSFVVKPFCKFKDFHEHSKKHMETHIHKTAQEAARLFLENVPVDAQIN